jgi:hypothetical protein
MIDDNKIKEHIYQNRESKGISQKEMAEKLGLDRTTYRSIEKGKTKLLNSHIYEIAEHLNISTEELVLGYFPDSESCATLEEYKTDMEEKIRKINSDHEKQVFALNKEIDNLKALNKELSARIKDKEDIIRLLKNSKS